MESELHPHRHGYRLLIVALFVGFAVITIAAIWQYQRMGLFQAPEGASTSPVSRLLRPSTEGGTSTLIPIKKADKALFSLAVPVGHAPFTQNQQITLQLKANSLNNKVVGYDALVTLPSQSFEFVSAKSMIKDFTIVKFAKKDHVTITAILKPGVKTPPLFSGEIVAELVIKPTQKGLFSLRVADEIGAETTKIVARTDNGSSIKVTSIVSAPLQLDIR